MNYKVAIAFSIPLVIALGVGIVGSVFCAMSLHVPRKIGSIPHGAATVSLLARDHAKLSAWWLRPSKPNGNCVVVLHGIGDSRAGSVGFAPMLLDAGYAVLVPDSRAHGASEGQFVTYGLLEKYDVTGWAQWMSGRGCGKIYGLGESMGASILIEASSVQPIFAAILTECPYADLSATAESRTRQMLHLPTLIAAPLAKLVVSSGFIYARWVHGLDFGRVSPVRSIAHSTTPTLLIHGLDDHRTPSANSIMLAKANPRNLLWLVEGAQHTGALAAKPAEFRRRVLEWFAEH